MEKRLWYPGFKGATREGEFVVLKTIPSGYVVQYTSGPSKGKFVVMPFIVGEPTRTIEGITPKGAYTIVRETPTGYLVEYLAGPWRGKFVEIPKEVKEPKKRVESLEMTIEQKERFLDLFYKLYEEEYLKVYDTLYKILGEEPLTSQMVDALRDEYPPLVQSALEEFFASETS